MLKPNGVVDCNNYVTSDSPALSGIIATDVGKGYIINLPSDGQNCLAYGFSLVK